MNNDFLTRPDMRTPRYHQSRADYGAAVIRYGKTERSRKKLDIALAVAIGVMLGVLFAWRG